MKLLCRFNLQSNLRLGCWVRVWWQSKYLCFLLDKKQIMAQRNWRIQHTQIHLTLLLSFNFHSLVMSFLHVISQPRPRYPLTLPSERCLVLASQVIIKIPHFWWERCGGSFGTSGPVSLHLEDGLDFSNLFNNSWRFSMVDRSRHCKSSTSQL